MLEGGFGPELLHVGLGVSGWVPDNGPSYGPHSGCLAALGASAVTVVWLEGRAESL